MWLLSRKGPSGYSASSTAEEVTRGIDGTGLTAIVTGASSGIGTETARVLAMRGVHVVMGVRNMSSGKEVKEAILKEIPTAKVDAIELDLSSLASVRKFVSEYNSLGLPLNLLINNAGIMATPFMLSKDKIELQFATNHIGHFLLTNLLLETMKETVRTTSKEGRIVNVSSRRHQFSYPEGIRFDKINDQSGYNQLSAYGQSKLANVLHANELARNLKDDRLEITANSLHPGAIATNLFRHHILFSGLIGVLGKYVIKNVQQGAATTCYVALHPQVKGMTGKYFADWGGKDMLCGIASTSRGKSGEYFSDSNVAKASGHAMNVELAKKLWDFSMNLVKKGPSGYSVSSTAEEVTRGIDGTGLAAIVTGASSGIGTETARVLAMHGVHVVMGVRNMSSGKEVKEAILKEIPNVKVDAIELDLSSLASVRKFVSEYNSLGLPLNLLM
ncbi:hypothetical protein LOK49_LG07G00373 [Camellia lanceoleosa]|uniref:Uncharacterized protein n=1 Tax=Camellia lanceoleosa TaxID=1840588 RepID=A0ACC0H354_9ERIC|nr:hypothetical protein LOK49_LG07G00373 [Camellia lanceoleosa]